MAQEGHAATRPQAKTASQCLAGLFRSHGEAGCITGLEAAGMLFAVGLVWAITCHGRTLPGLKAILPP